MSQIFRKSFKEPSYSESLKASSLKKATSCHTNWNPTWESYENSLLERQELKKLCQLDERKIFDLQIQKADERKLRAKLKTPQILREYIEQLKEKSDVLKKIMNDLGKEFVGLKLEYGKVEKVLLLQEAALNKVEKENLKVEQELNDDIGKIRKVFIEQRKELCEVREKYNSTQCEIAESLEKQNKLEKDLKVKKLELKQILCELKRFRKPSGESSVTLKMLEKLSNKREKYSKRSSEIESEVDCIKQRICEADQETEVVRKAVKSQLHVVQMHNEWQLEQLQKRKQNLETMIDKFYRLRLSKN